MKSRLRTALLSLSALASTPALAEPLADADRTAILAEVDRGAPAMARNALQIWSWAEVGFQETKSSGLLQKDLKAAGFKVTAGVAGMPTAFVASFKTGDGPVIGILAEYDALPGLAQAAEPERHVIDGIAGHACGHNLFGAASVAAAIATKNWMVAHGIKGELRVYGAPAEEGGSGKVFLVRSGLTKDVSAMLHWHAGDGYSAMQGHALANVSAKFRFHGLASHAAAAPERGRSALDGVEAMDNMVNMMREHVPQETRIHYVITDGGKAPNVVPDTAEVYYYVRHPDQQQVADIMERVKKAAEGAALGTGTTVEYDQIGGTFDLLPNDTLGRVMYDNLKQVPLPTYTAQEQAFIDKIETTLPKGGRKRPTGVEPYSSGEIMSASTDVGDVSYTTPTAGMSAGTWAPGTPPHSWQAVAASGNSVGTKGAEVAAKTLALSAAQLFQSPDTLAAAKKELDERRGPDFVYRSLLGDKAPSLDYRKAASSKD
ncbi:MAG: amidohydrolase [Novosphingobium lindaniclasticum]|jgi:aminobenzoyl-glutamate utilization protein B|uniref:amidohydrolase n=1 Tax=Novosphingobium lindaniclasticum TaxID=1329895 RepID=UPI0024090C21|nr:amidohydrolase [Novosphingobium lindaniclasticum]MDF2640586.1 amidohydrolase [Novosphingobium lindaniclasticum]